jgi:hypothetical protein
MGDKGKGMPCAQVTKHHTMYDIQGSGDVTPVFLKL